MSFVVRIDDMTALLESWNQLLATASGSQVFTTNDEVFQTLNEWSRIKWFYYCDDADGNTLRLYDGEHFEHFGGSYYLERDNSQSQCHFERVILRGKNMWADDEANLKRPQSLRNRFRDNPAWIIFSARQAPLRPGGNPPPELRLPVHRGTHPRRTSKGKCYERGGCGTSSLSTNSQSTTPLAKVFIHHDQGQR